MRHSCSVVLGLIVSTAGVALTSTADAGEAAVPAPVNYARPFAAALEGWPLWACGLLGRAMTGYYAGSGDERVLKALETAYGEDADCLRWITGSVSNLWPAYDTYCWTGNPGVATALDGMFKSEGVRLLPSLGRYREAPDLRPGATVDNAHVVEFLEGTTPWAVGYLWTGDKRYLQAAVGWHDLLERVAMQPHGVPVSDEWYGPTGAFRGSETCDVAGYVPKAPQLPLLPFAKRTPAERLTLVPYGCTKFRISMFPVSAGPEVQPADIRRILFLGNSITLHGPNADIGWTGNWGMAASSEDKDYVHLVAKAIAQHTGSTPRIMVRNIAEFERNYATYDVDQQLKDCFAFDPDLVVLAVGENVPAIGSEESKAQFKAGVMSILRCALARRHPLIVVRSCFWADDAKDQVLREACREVDGLFVDAGALGRDAGNAARSERTFAHEGVAGHPGDRGMKALADAIVKVVLDSGGKGRGPGLP